MKFPNDVKTYNEIWSENFQNFVNERFNINYRYAPIMMYPYQNTYWTYEVGMWDYDGVYSWDEFGHAVSFDLDRFMEDLVNAKPDDKPNPHDILEALYQMDEIPAGVYLFLVWW